MFPSVPVLKYFLFYAMLIGFLKTPYKVNFSFSSVAVVSDFDQLENASAVASITVLGTYRRSTSAWNRLLL